MARVTDVQWTFEWRRTWDEVFAPAFVARWKALVAQTTVSTAYQRPEVARAWVETCGDAVGAQPMVGVATSRHGEVLFPFTIVTSRGRFTTRRVLEFIGQDLFGYGDPIAAVGRPDTFDWSELWESVRAETAGFCHQGLLRSIDAQFAASNSRLAEGAPVLALDTSSLEGILARCPRSHRGDIRRQFRHFSERGNLSLRIFGPTDRDAASVALDALLRAYAARCDVRPEYPSLDRLGLRALWRRVAEEGTAAGWGHLAMLTVDGQPVAWHLGLFHDDELYWWVPTHDPAWEALSPGKVLLAKLIEHGIASGWRRLHFLPGTQPYKMAWRPDVPERRVMRWYSPTVAGTLLSHYDRRAALV
jgi:CelD/BcsL family acetyltransferase involved in cellulose biosynthesis